MGALRGSEWLLSEGSVVERLYDLGFRKQEGEGQGLGVEGFMGFGASRLHDLRV